MFFPSSLWWSVILWNFKGGECNYPILALTIKIVTHPFTWGSITFIWCMYLSSYMVLVCVRLNLMWEGECINWIHDKFSQFTHNIINISFELKDMISVQKIGKRFQFKMCNNACNMVYVTIIRLNKVSLKWKNKIW